MRLKIYRKLLIILTIIGLNGEKNIQGAEEESTPFLNDSLRGLYERYGSQFTSPSKKRLMELLTSPDVEELVEKNDLEFGPFPIYHLPLEGCLARKKGNTIYEQHDNCVMSITGLPDEKSMIITKTTIGTGALEVIKQTNTYFINKNADFLLKVCEVFPGSKTFYRFKK